MKLALGSALVLVSLLVAGCGGGSAGEPGALDGTLGYFPEDAGSPGKTM